MSDLVRFSCWRFGRPNALPLSCGPAARAGLTMILQSPCGRTDSFNGRFDGGQQAGATRLRDLRRPASTDQRKVNDSLPTTGLAIPSGDRPSNALPFSGGRPSAADRPLQRHVGRLLNQGSEPRASAIAVRVFRAPGVTAHSFFLPDQKVTPGSGLAGSPSPNSRHLSTSEVHHKYQVRPTLCR